MKRLSYFDKIETDWQGPFFLSFLFLLTRLLHLLFCFLPYFFVGELLTGTLAKELIGGLKLPFFEYAMDHYQGGVLVYGISAVPFFLLFGKTVFSLRLTGVLFSYGSFITWYFFIRRFFGKREALFASLLYLCAPSWHTLYAMFAFGAHAEPLFFTAAGLFLLYKILYEKTHSLRNALLLGLISGFGTYFTYGFFVGVVTFLLFWFYEDHRIFQKKEFYLFSLFFLIGFSPWFLYNVTHQFRGMELLRVSFMSLHDEQPLPRISYRFLKLITLRILQMLSFNYREGAHITFLNFFYYAVLLFSYLLLYRFQRKNRKTHFFCLFPFLYLLIASISQLEIPTYLNRYFLPLFPFFFAVIALGLTQLERISKPLKKLSLTVLLLLLAMGVKGELDLISFKEFGLALKYRGYSYGDLGWAFLYRYDGELSQLSYLGKKVSPRLPPRDRLAFYSALCHAEYDIEKPEDLQKYLSWVKGFDISYQPFFLRVIGFVWGSSDGLFSKKVSYVTESLEEETQPYLIEGLVDSLYPETSRMKPDITIGTVLKQMHTLSPKNQRALAYALGKLSWRYSYEACFLDKIKRRASIESRLPPELVSIYYRGVGVHLVKFYDVLRGNWSEMVIQHIARINPSYQEAIYWGAGFEAPFLYEDPFEYERMESSIPSEFRKAFEQGLQDRFSWGGRNRWIEF